MGLKKALKMEIRLTEQWIRELEIIMRKYTRKLENTKRKKIEKQGMFKTVEEVHEAYGYCEISDAEYQSLCNFFEGIEESDESLDSLLLCDLEKELNTKRKHLYNMKSQLEFEEGSL